MGKQLEEHHLRQNRLSPYHFHYRRLVLEFHPRPFFIFLQDFKLYSTLKLDN